MKIPERIVEDLKETAHNLNKLQAVDTEHTVMGVHLIDQHGSEANLIARSLGFEVKPKPKSSEPFLDRNEEATLRKVMIHGPTSTVAEDSHHAGRQVKPPETRYKG